MSTNCTAVMKSRPTPGHWNTVSVMMANAMIEPICSPVMAAYLVLIALIFVVINLIVDLLYFVVDPRLRVQRTGRGH